MLATDKSTLTGTRAAGGGVRGSAPSAGLTALPRVCCLSGRKRVGLGREGQYPEGSRAASRIRVPAPRPRALTVGAVNCPVTARWEPTGPAPPGAHLDFRRAQPEAITGAGPGGVGQSGAVGRVAGCAVSGRAWCRQGEGLGRGRGFYLIVK